jgi:hypothetical protein
MPLKDNIGASKKVVDQNYGSRGASVNLEIELDASLVTAPAKLQEKIRHLFGLVRQSLAEELNGAASNGHAPKSDNSNGQSRPASANGNGNGTSRDGRQRQATQSQVRAIHAIARTRRIDIAHFLNERFRISKPDDLTIKEASQVIDELKADANTEGSR